MVGICFGGLQYEIIEPIGTGTFGSVVLIRNEETGYRFAMKCISRGSSSVMDGRIEREILNHRSLRHPNVIRFVQLVLIPNHLGIIMEYAKGGSFSEKIINDQGLSENEARNYFQQLICGVSYCHYKGICHRDLKPNNILWLGNRLAICDFGYSKSSEVHSPPDSVLGTPLYVAPEVFSKEYDGKVADAWSCGAILYAMLSGKHAFLDRTDPRNEEKTSSCIKDALDSISANVSRECKDLLRRLLAINPQERITIEEIKNHQWFLEGLPEELTRARQAVFYQRENKSFQSVTEIRQIIEDAKTKPSVQDVDDDSDEDIADADYNMSP